MDRADALNDCNRAQRRKFEPWESDRLKQVYHSDFKDLYCRPFRRRSEHVPDDTLGKIAGIVEAAYATSFYPDLYSKHGLPPKPNFSRFADLDRFPIVDKSLMNNFLLENNKQEKLFETWTCGTSGRRRFIFFDLDAVIIDTLQGARQLLLQSHNRVAAEDIATHYYAYPWYVDRINEREWQSKFIPRTTSASEAAQQIRQDLPAVLYGYPSDIRRLMAELEPKELQLKLIITNSEQSSPSERKRMSDHFGCPVRDEYSTEELTRIALEMPDGHYYAHEDSVYLEVLDPKTRQPAPDGQWGEVVATGLLNKVMPFVRYSTGDLVKKSPDGEGNELGIKWRRLAGVGGRVQDSFLHPDPDEPLIPSSVLLEEIENRTYERDLQIAKYRVDQKSPGEVALTVYASEDLKTETADFAELVKEVLELHFDRLPKLSVDTAQLDPEVRPESKRRPIRSSHHRAQLARLATQQ